MHNIVVMGLGPGDMGQLPLENYRLLQKAENVFFRTEKHPLVEELRSEGIRFQGLDYFYEQFEDFQDVYRGIASHLWQEAEKGQVIYAVPGHPLVAEETVAILLDLAREAGLNLTILPAMSFLDVMFNSLYIDPINGLKVIDALSDIKPDPSVANIVTQVHSPLVAADLKIRLMDTYPDEFVVTVIRAAGVQGQEQMVQVPLFKLDRLDWVDYLTSVYLPPFPDKAAHPLERLSNILARLRSPEGCPWDREQTHKTLEPYLLEETYEVLEALEEGNMYKICEELGDLLLQIVFHAQIAKESEYFDINDVIMEITEKLIRRHPHVFSTAKVNDSKDVVLNWEAIKKQEKEEQGLNTQSVLAGIPKTMPALLKADKLQRKAAKVGFDWPDYRGALEKVKEELVETEEAISLSDQSLMQDELGDLLFAVVNLGRLLGIDPEVALIGTNRKFQQRFEYIEDKLRKNNVDWKNTNLKILDQIWEEAKRK